MNKMKINNFICIRIFICLKSIKIKIQELLGFLSVLFSLIVLSYPLLCFLKWNLSKVPIHFF